MEDPKDRRKRLYLTVPEAGMIAAGLGRSASYAAARRGDLPTVKVGSRIVVPIGKLREMYGLAAEEPVEEIA